MISKTAGLIRRYPLSTYVVLAYAFSITLGLLLNVSLLFGLIALFGPAAAAFIVARIWRGRAGVGELWAVTTRWRVHPVWYIAALALPIAGTAIGHVLYVLAGNAAIPVPGKVEPILLVLFFLVIGEEIGWRGFLLRGLLSRAVTTCGDPGCRCCVDAVAQPAVFHSWNAVVRKSVLGLHTVGVHVLVLDDLAVARHPERLADNDHAWRREPRRIARVSTR